MSQRCPHCEARNAAGAVWCSLCYERIEAPPADPPPPPIVALVSPSGVLTVADLPPPQIAAVPASRELATDRATFRTTPHGMEWACACCAEFNPLDSRACGTCGTAFGTPDPADAPVIDLDPLHAVGLSLLLPGAGHWAAGNRGLGVGLAMIHLMFAGGALTLFLAARGASRGMIAIAPLVMGALALMLGAALDARTMATGGGRLLLDSRALLWLVVGTLGSVTVLFLVTAMSL